MDFIGIDKRSDYPVYIQISNQIETAAAIGALPNGSLLPSMERFASDLAVNHNTVSRAFRHLESRGVLVRSRGKNSEISFKYSTPVKETLSIAIGSLVGLLSRFGRFEAGTIGMISVKHAFGEGICTCDPGNTLCMEMASLRKSHFLSIIEMYAILKIALEQSFPGTDPSDQIKNDIGV